MTEKEKIKIEQKRKGLRVLEYAMISLSILLICVLIFVDNNNPNSKITIKTTVSSLNKGVNRKININTADMEEIATLKGIGNIKAKNIVEYRKKNGKFKSIKEIKNVHGIGEYTYNNIKNDIFV